VFVAQAGLVCQLRCLVLLAVIGEDALAQFAGIGDEIQFFGFALFVLAEDGAGHGVFLLDKCAGWRSSSLRIGAGRPMSASSAGENQRRSALPPTLAAGTALRRCSGCRCNR